MACDVPEPCKFPSLDSCQKPFLRTHKEVDITQHPVVDLVFRVENAVNASGIKLSWFPITRCNFVVKITPPTPDQVERIKLNFSLVNI